MRSTLLGTLALLFAAPLYAQSGHDRMLTTDDMQHLRPESCTLADSLAGQALARPKEFALAWKNGEERNLVSGDVFAFTAHRPVDGILLTATYTGEGPAAEVGYGMQLRLKDSVLREGTSALFTLVLDSAEVRVGGMEASNTPFSHGHTIDQVLSIGIAPRSVQRLVVAHDVRGRIGTWEFPVPAKTLETFKSVFIAATCGTKIR